MWEDNIETDLEDVCCEPVDWVQFFPTTPSNGFYERVNKTSGPTNGVKFFESPKDSFSLQKGPVP